MLRAHLSQFLGSINEIKPLAEQDADRIRRLVVLYLMGRRKADDFRKLGRDLDLTEQLFDFKQTFLDRNYYCISVFWRLVIDYYRRLPDAPDDVVIDRALARKAVKDLPHVNCKYSKTAADDIRFLEVALPLAEHRRLHRIALTSTQLNPTLTDLMPLIKKLQRLCNGLAYKKLRFLAQNDYGLSLDDLSAEIFEAALRTLCKYDGEENADKLYNTAKKGAVHHMIRLLEYHTTKRRRRILRVVEPATVAKKVCGTCSCYDLKLNGVSCRDRGMLPSDNKCAAKSIGLAYREHIFTEERICSNCRFYDEKHPTAEKPCALIDQDPKADTCAAYVAKAEQVGEYTQTVTSLDRTVGSNDETPIIDIYDHSHPTQEQGFVSREFLANVYHHVSDDAQRVIDIVMGKDDPEFEAWLSSETDKTADDLHPTLLARKACKFMGTSLRAVRSDLQHAALA